ncbi:MAG: conserved hypothetical protein [Candidatus Desulfovibrio kirbyi]|uniref:Outer membrane homotrimeric porin n=1 Tax=Candidatus Desulfovibrio kirbyi TaxID=2696086 RepID=A0A6L2R458_9BACT|nr:MAG: conserved hypothetical protein [Candidatus Desulfovibrio kirbyi]
MKRICTLLLAAALLFGSVSGASSIDFQVKGEWKVGFGAGDTAFINKQRESSGSKTKVNNEDKLAAMQRTLLQIDAVASEALSGTVFFEIGDTKWGENGSGGALGTDSTSIIKLKNAYIDWTVPQTDLRFRMGLQGVTLPNMAGGSAVFDTDAAGITASYQFNDAVGITFLWVRPFNDNFDPNVADNYPTRTLLNKSDNGNYLDNLDLFALLLPLKFDGFEATPWVMYGIGGRNYANFVAYRGGELGDGRPDYTLSPYPAAMDDQAFARKQAYGSLFWAGLPFAITAFDPLNIEFDINYGYAESLGRYDAVRRNSDIVRRSSSERSGWVAKALVEYKMEWATPGIFGWYASGDDGNPKNGSERMPSIAPFGNFTSFMGDGPGWAPDGSYYDRSTSYAGTWGLGVRLKDMSFIEDLQHTFTIAYWGGTNSPSMVKYMGSAYDWDNGTLEGPYMTTNDGMVEFNLGNTWQVYENLTMDVELGYIVNAMDNGTWNKTRTGRDTSFEKQDAWKAHVIFTYSF